MTTSSRQNNLILNEDWTRIYQTFRNADFKSYDFENIRRVMIEYIRENYPEDFNDYIESSEYMALIDAIAFMGQSISFRIDLASRENFIELAERKESVLRLARMLSYNAKRNIPAEGLLKFDTISTTENLLDSNGRNLAQQTIVWNDATNPNWNEQFLIILNSAMADNTEFGRSQGSSVIQGINTDQYRFRSSNTDVPIFSYGKSVAGRRMLFEIASTTFKGAERIYEESPFPGNQLGFIYRNDSRGPASANTGFFFLFKQGSLEVADFEIAIPSSNETVSIDAEGINNTDIWLYSLDANAIQTNQWVAVPSITGNNIAYNSIINGDRNIYAVVTRENDKIDLLFADGTYGNLPQGSFRIYYRVSNGLSYSISPAEMRGITIEVPYLNKVGAAHTLTITMSLKSTVSSAAPSEDIDAIRINAPANYYVQNRMVTGEDYNLAPLTSSQDILKVKAINRTSSGVSRNFDIIDASGNYSSVEVFADDGLIYKSEVETALSFKFTSRIDILNFIRRSLEPVFETSDVYNFYLTKYTKINFIDDTSKWVQITDDLNLSTGYFINTVDNTILKTGIYTNNTLKYLTNDSLIKFVPPENKAFKKGQIVDIDHSDPEQSSYIWTKVVRIVGDGTNAGRGALSTGLGPVQFTDTVPDGSIASRILPKFVSNIPSNIETQIVNIVFSNQNFGLRYDIADTSWKIITSSNLNLVDDFSLGTTGDLSNNNLDSSWIVSFVKQPDRYAVTVRSMEYVFGSLNKNRFYFDVNQKIYDSRTGKTIRDQVKVLGINTSFDRISPLKQTLSFAISDAIKFEDGYQSDNEIKISFLDSDDDGVIDDPDQFIRIVGEDLDDPQNRYIFFETVIDQFGSKTYKYIDNSDDFILIREKETLENVEDYSDGQLIFFYSIDEQIVKRVDRSTNTFVIDSLYRANIGRAGLIFQYVHNANVDRRIDPSVSNIIDVYLLTKSYDTDFRNWLKGAVLVRPEPPTTDSLRISFGKNLDPIKTISDEIVYHPAEYKILFGQYADPKFRATFKVVKNPNRTINDNDLKVRIINSIDTFFEITNWDFGDRFYLSELITYIVTRTAPDISNIIIVPTQPSQVFGSLFEIQSGQDEILVSGATVDDIEIVSAISASEINADPNTVITSTE
jgi:hypothetical protein